MGEVLRKRIAGPYDPTWSEVEYLPGEARDALRLETVRRRFSRIPCPASTMYAVSTLSYVWFTST
jgi:hypothetical protein